MTSTVERARALARDQTSFMPTRETWEEAQKILLQLANELEQIRLAARAIPEGDTTERESITAMSKE